MLPLRNPIDRLDQSPYPWRQVSNSPVATPISGCLKMDLLAMNHSAECKDDDLAKAEYLGPVKLLGLYLAVFCGMAIIDRFVTKGFFLSAGALIVALVFVTIGLTELYYNRLSRAADWCRWDEVLSLVAGIRQRGLHYFVKVSPLEVSRYRAKALASRGDLSSALAEFQLWENHPDCPLWLYYSCLVGFYSVAKQHDQAMEFTLKSLTEHPTADVYLELANRLLRHQKDAVRAREALHKAEQAGYSDFAVPFVCRCYGILRYLEGDYPLAETKLKEALALMEETPRTPYREGHINVTKAYLCCVLVNQGDVNAAKQYLSEARPYLMATDEWKLLEECNRALAVGIET